MHICCKISGLDVVFSRLEQVEQRPFHAVPRLNDNSDTSDEIDIGEPRQRIRSKMPYKMKKTWGPVMLVSFFRLGPHMLWQSPAISFVVLVARTSLYWLMVTTKYCDIYRATSIFHATNVWGWRCQAGKCSIMKGLPWVLQKWSDSGRKKGGLLWSLETGSSLFPRTSLSTRLVQWTRILGLWPRFLPSLKCCVWAEVMNWCTTSGRSLL